MIIDLDNRYCNLTEKYAKIILEDCSKEFSKTRSRVNQKLLRGSVRAITKLLFIIHNDQYGYAVVPLNKSYYKGDNKPSYSYMVSLLPILHNLKWIKFKKVEQTKEYSFIPDDYLGMKGKSSTINRGSKWKKLIKGSNPKQESSRAIAPRDVLEIRQKIGKGKYKLLPLPDSIETKEYQSLITSVNDYLATVHMEYQSERLHLELKRTFSGQFGSGGRWYDNSTRIQGLPRSVRSKLTIDGECVAELDYASCQFRILAEIQGVKLDKTFDPYAIEVTGDSELDRELGKLSGSIVVNTRNRTAAYSAIRKNSNHDINPKQLCEAFIERNPYVDMFAYGKELDGVPAGLRLQFLDSQICAHVIMLARSDCVSLYPIHDSFLCKYSDRDKVKKYMEMAWETVLQSNHNCLVRLED